MDNRIFFLKTFIISSFLVSTKGWNKKIKCLHKCIARQSRNKIMNRKGAKLAKEQRGEKMINREGEWSNTIIGFATDWSMIYNILVFAFIASLRFNSLAKKCKSSPVIL